MSRTNGWDTNPRRLRVWLEGKVTPEADRIRGRNPGITREQAKREARELVRERNLADWFIAFESRPSHARRRNNRKGGKR